MVRILISFIYNFLVSGALSSIGLAWTIAAALVLMLVTARVRMIRERGGDA